MRGQLVYQCQRLFSTHFLKTTTQSRLYCLACVQSNHQKWRKPRQIPSQRPALPLKELRRWRSSIVATGHRDCILPGNIVKSPVKDIDIPDISFHEFLFDRLPEFKNRSAISEFLTGKSYTFEEMLAKTIKVASALNRFGYRKGDVIIAFTSNNADFPLLMSAASCLGLIFSTANANFTIDELALQMTSCNAKAVFMAPQLAQTAKDAANRLDNPKQIKGFFVFGDEAVAGCCPFQELLDDDGKAFPDVSINPKEDVFLLPYSSGTTGLPKGVMLTHQNVVSNILQINQTLIVSPDDNSVGILPLYHIYGMIVIQFSMLFGGGHIHYLPKFEPESFLRCMQDRKINVAHLVPPLILFLARHPLVSEFDLSHLKNILCAAAPLGEVLITELKKRFSQEIIINQGYGLTETSPGATIDIGENISSIGPLLCNTLAKIVDLDSGKNMGANEEGEIFLKGPQVMKGYINNQKATDEMIDSDGWLHTGDIGYYNERGLLYISDRLKELIKYKGSQVAPAELEALILAHEEVHDVAVIGIPDESSGEVPRAFVVKKPNSNVTDYDIIEYVKERVSNFKRLRGGVEFVDEIPKNPSGKILRRQLRKQ